MNKTLKELSPLFWYYAINAQKPGKTKESYKIAYLLNHIGRALITGLKEPFYASAYAGNILDVVSLNEFEKIDNDIRSLPGFTKYDNETDHNDVKAALNCIKDSLYI